MIQMGNMYLLRSPDPHGWLNAPVMDETLIETADPSWCEVEILHPQYGPEVSIGEPSVDIQFGGKLCLRTSEGILLPNSALHPSFRKWKPDFSSPRLPPYWASSSDP